MRVGPEQFIYRDFAFIDAMILPVVGPKTVAIYDVLRRYIWRASDKGAKRSRDAFKKGKLSASITRSKLAEMSGVSVRTVQRHLNRLRDISWVRWESGNGTGETVVYELGFRTPDGAEVFYADASARKLWLGLEELAVQSEVERVNDLPCDVRLAFTRGWFDPEGGGDKNVTREVSSVSPGVVTEMAPSNREPFGEEIEKGSEYAGRSAPTQPTGPGPKHWDQPAGQERRRRSRKKKDRETSGAEFAIDSALDSRQDEEDRLERAAAAGKIGKSKADKQHEADVRRAQRRLEEKRTEQVEKGQANEQRAKNLKGGTKYTHAVLKAARRAWDVYSDLIRSDFPGMPVVRWNADGNAKARGQMCRLVDMYGGDATVQAIRYVVGNWDAINKRFFKKGPGSVPNFGLLLSMHESLFRESALWGQHREVVEEWEAWQHEHEDDDETPPSELQGRYEQARTALESLGLGG